MKKTTIWTIVALVGLYVIAQAIADVGATKLALVGGAVLPAGTFIFALTFTLRDFIHKRLGKEWARAAIVVAALLNILQAVYLGAVARLPVPDFYGLGDAWAAVFAIVPAITIGSIFAEFISENVDTEVYDWVRRRGWPQWSRVIVSNLVSIPVDSFIFGLLAFVVLPPLFGAEGMPFLALLPRLVGGQSMWKAIVAIVSAPLTYLIPDRVISDVAS